MTEATHLGNLSGASVEFLLGFAAGRYLCLRDEAKRRINEETSGVSSLQRRSLYADLEAAEFWLGEISDKRKRLGQHPVQLHAWLVRACEPSFDWRQAYIAALSTESASDMG